MLVKIQSIANVGLETVPVDVEVDISSVGLPNFTIVGLPSKAVEEARERVKTAIINSGLNFPTHKITVNLAPADLPKDGAAYDLPIAVGIILASHQANFTQKINLNEMFFYGELSLDGSLRNTRGILLLALFAKKKPNSAIFVPSVNANEAAVVTGIKVLPVNNLNQVIAHLAQIKLINPLTHPKIQEILTFEAEFDLQEVAGQEQAKRALIIAAAGGHNLLMQGPPGTGKTMLARVLPGILPPLSYQEALEVTRIYSVAGLLATGQSLISKRPFRAPHHGISLAGMIGGGSNPLPGEVSLAHLGVLFLDETPEFPRSVLESLRQPMENGQVEIVRVAGHVHYPASFTLVAAVNPCPCGYLGHPTKECKCTEKQIIKYRQRLSGPILDRIDLGVTVNPVQIDKLTLTTSQTANRLTSKQARTQVLEARERQAKRFKNLSIYTNSQMRNREVKQYAQLTSEAENLLKVAATRYDFSARSYYRLIKTSRTIADLAGSTKIGPTHMAEALQYKQIL